MFTFETVPDPLLESGLAQAEMGLNGRHLLLLQETTDVDMVRAILRSALMNVATQNQGRLRHLLLTDLVGFEREMRVKLPAGEVREHWEPPGGAR